MNLDEAYDRALSGYDGSAERWDEMSERDRVLVTLWGLQADVAQSGFRQYFYNHSGDQAHYAETALRRIGAEETAAIVARATSIFGTGGVPRDRALRQAVLEQVEDACEDLLRDCDRRFVDCGDDLSALAEKYLGESAEPGS